MPGLHCKADHNLQSSINNYTPSIIRKRLPWLPCKADHNLQSCYQRLQQSDLQGCQGKGCKTNLQSVLKHELLEARLHQLGPPLPQARHHAAPHAGALSHLQRPAFPTQTKQDYQQL